MRRGTPMTTINPGLRMVQRSATSIQIGVGPGGTIIEGLQPRDVAFIEALREGIADSQLASTARALGMGEERVRDICASLNGLLFGDEELAMRGFRSERLLPEHAALLGLHQEPCRKYMARREHAVVHVMGLGRTGAALALVLVSAGVGTIFLEDDRPVMAVDVAPGSYKLADIGLMRSVAVRRAALALDPGTHAHILHESGPTGPDTRCLDLAIVVAHDAVGAETAGRFMSLDLPHLLVLVREQEGTVGPFVMPGVTACADCVERHRGAHDPLWLNLCEQLSARQGKPADHRHRPEHLENAALAMALAGTAAAQALLFLDGVNQPSAWSSVLTFHPGNAHWSREEFALHPDCGCQLQRQALATISSTASP